MTVAIGLVCSSGVVVGADSMGTHGRLASPITKVFAFKDIPAVWTFAGSMYVAQEVEEHLRDLEDDWSGDAAWDQMSPTDIKRAITAKVAPAIKASYANLQHPPGTKAADHSVDFMFGFWKPDAPGFLIRLHPDLASHISPEPFASIGYGHEYATVARALMGHHLQRTPTLHQGQLLAHRTISTVCEVSSGGVGPPVQLAVVDADGARVIGSGDVDAVSVAVDRWKQLERETLDLGNEDDPKIDVALDLPVFEAGIEEASRL